MNSKLMSIVAIFTIIAIIITLKSGTVNITEVFNKKSEVTIVLDPGHGGIDGGAESAGGVSEKDINLRISTELASLLEDAGINVIMTRFEDVGLYEQDDSAAIRTLKTQDMHRRKAIIDNAGAALAVSIHLNSFTEDRNVRGAQVFYPGEGDEMLVSKSKVAAEIVQQMLNEDINSVKQRSALQKDDVFILRDIKCPTVIVECGFLSNYDEANKLSNHAYQVKIAKTLEASICKFLEQNY